MLALIALPIAVNGQVAPIYDRGTAGLGQMLNRINTTASVMMIGAHPDDEDSALLAYLARGENARTAYLSLTRGDGGQNIIGPELFESLGVIRTEELLQARRLDGAEQYFARAFDYGFSKTLDEAKQKWDEKVLLCDIVRAIRSFRPLVVISRFSGTANDGHGQHQFAGYISPLAVKVAADAGQCTQSGTPWRVLKFYAGHSFRATTEPGLRINTGKFDPLLGRTYFEVAMEGRSQHRSQGEGRVQFHGDQFSGLNLVDSTVAKISAEKSIFDGIDISITGIKKFGKTQSDSLSRSLNSVQSFFGKARDDYEPYSPGTLLVTLADGMKALRQAKSLSTDIDVKSLVERKEAELVKAIRLAAGLQIDALADTEVVVPGEDFNSSVKVFVAGRPAIEVRDISIKVPDRWTVAKVDPPKESTSVFNPREAAFAAAYFNVKVPASANATQPYWLKAPRDGDLFQWPDDNDQTLPFQAPIATASIVLLVGDHEISVDEPLMFRFAEPTRGEVRRELNVVPSVTLEVDQKLVIVPSSEKTQSRTVTVSVTNHSSIPRTGTVSLNFSSDSGWDYTADSKTVILKTKGEKQSVTFDVTIPAGTKTGQYAISPSIVVGEVLASGTMHTIAYPHIQTHRFYTRAETAVNVLDLKTVPVNVGYIMGSGDEVADAIRQMGLAVQMLEEKDLALSELSRFDSIVVGIRASETRPDLLANSGRLLEYVKNGGNLIVQYQRQSFGQQKLLPYPAAIGPRVVDEDAKVSILQPDHPAFNYPNKISDVDFAGWVQERNLYNLDKFDEQQYLPLLESHDAGEPENRGGLVVAKVGNGTFIYCSYSFFRQLPAGVSGAYRLFSNLLSLPKAPK